MKTLEKIALFWDVDREALDSDQHRRFIVERVLSRGDLDDVRWAKDQYGDEELKQVLLQTKSLDPRSLSFWCSYFHIDPKQCLQKPSLRRRAAFWKK